MSTQLLKVTKPNSLADMIDARAARRITQRAGAHNAARGHKMAIFANDLIGIQINQYGLYEREELDILFNFLSPLAAEFAEGLAFDIGANIGNHALYFAKRFKAVHAWEPNPSTYELLKFNTQWAGNVTPHPYGLGDAKGRFELIEHPDNLGGSSIRIGNRSSGQVVPIQVETLDEQNVATGDLCFMKIDVEGFEANVLNGGINTILVRQPLIVFEQHESEFVEGSTASIAILGARGYRFCWHQTPEVPGSWLARRIVNLREMLSGRTHSIETANVVPPCNHSMLIAVPQRFQQRLGLRG